MLSLLCCESENEFWKSGLSQEKFILPSPIDCCYGYSLDEILEMVCNLMINVDPWPRPLLSTLTSPPICSIKCLQMLNPNPVPCLLRFSLSANLLKLMKSLPMSSSLMPGPESVMRISKEMKLTFSECYEGLSKRDEMFRSDSNTLDSGDLN